MFLALPLAPIVAATGVTNTLFFSEAVLDLLGVIAAIWTLWVYVWLPLSGFTRSAFRLFVLGGMTFALLHVLDTIFQVWTVLSKGLPTLIHFGLVLVALVFFVLGLARLADAMSGFRRPQRDDVLQQRWWPLAVALALILGVSSFIIWGLNLLAIFWADVAVDAGIVVLALACAVQVWRTQLGGAIGGALWTALFGLLVFALAHPVQTWISVAQILPPTIGPLLHRLVVIPAFILFSASITRLSKALTPRTQQETGELVSVGVGRQSYR